MAKRQPFPPEDVEIEEANGRRYRGTYRVESGVVTVSYPGGGSKSTQVGASSPAHIARLLLGELVMAAKAEAKRREAKVRDRKG